MQPTLVLIPGMLCDHRLFKNQIEDLERFFNIVVADISQHNTIEKIANSILNSIKSEMFSIAGLSMGGIVAMEVVKQASHRVERLALLNTTHHADTDARRDLRKQQILRVKKGQLKQLLINDIMPLYLRSNSMPPLRYMAKVLQMALEHGDDVFIRQSEALSLRPDYSTVLASYQGKTLILTGDSDQLCPVDRHEEMASIMNNADLFVIPKCGHLSTLEEPLKVNRYLRHWIL